MAYSDSFKETISERILEIMEGLAKQGMSQREFADKIRVDPSAISNLKRRDAWNRIPTGYWKIFQQLSNNMIEFNGTELIDHQKPAFRAGDTKVQKHDDEPRQDEIPIADYVMEYTRDEDGRRKLIIEVMADITIELSLRHGANVTIKTV